MRKFIILVFILGFIGSAGAAEKTYVFTANMSNVYVDGAEIFSELGYYQGMPLKGTITIDTEAEPINTDPNAGFWDTGFVKFEKQGYTWLDACTRNLYISSFSGQKIIQIWTKQFSLVVDPEVPVPGELEVQQMVILTSDGQDANMPDDLSMGVSSEYIVQIKKNGKVSVFLANIEKLEKVDLSANTADSVEDDLAERCPKNNRWKNHGDYVQCVAQFTTGLVESGTITGEKKGFLVSQAAKSDVGKKKK